jgi:effector-binding domain-containing protein
MLTQPKIESRDAQPYAGIRSRVSMQEVSTVLPSLISEVMAWLGARGSVPAGPPFFRYRVIDMARELEIDVGVPVAIPLTGDQRIVTDIIPAGNYATLIHTGHFDQLIEANKALQEWGKCNGIEWRKSEGEHGSVWVSRLEIYLTNPATEANPQKWETEIAYLVDDVNPKPEQPIW